MDDASTGFLLLQQIKMLCCAVLCCAVLCCAVLCCAVLCCAVLCCAVQGDVHKRKEIVQDVTLHDLDSANARPAGGQDIMRYGHRAWEHILPTSVTPAGS
jgi:hypothetical protein